MHHCTYAHAHTVADLGTKLQTNGAANGSTDPAAVFKHNGKPLSGTIGSTHLYANRFTNGRAHDRSIGCTHDITDNSSAHVNSVKTPYSVSHSKPVKHTHTAAHRDPNGIAVNSHDYACSSYR